MELAEMAAQVELAMNKARINSFILSTTRG
jgi:hypothetical protein